VNDSARPVITRRNSALAVELSQDVPGGGRCLAALIASASASVWVWVWAAVPFGVVAVITDDERRCLVRLNAKVVRGTGN
jgi:hypothetical protein